MIKYFVILLAQLVAIPVAGFWRANGENARIANQEIIGDAAPVTIDLRPEVYADLPAPVRRYFDYAFSSLRMRFSFRNRSFSRSRSARAGLTKYLRARRARAARCLKRRRVL